MKTDEELYAAAIDGGPEAFAHIVERYQDAVFGIALARLRDFHEAEDAAQEAFIEAYERLHSLRSPSKLGAWLRSITIHRSIDRLRRRRSPADIREEAMPATDDPTPHEEIERRELRDEVLAAIGRLSKKQRETATLFYINGYSVQEVAGMQEVPVGTVKRRLHDAREKLKQEMITMVEDILKSEAPKEDFSKRVFELLSGQHELTWPELVEEMKRIGAVGFDGFRRALASPRWQTRRMSMAMLRHGEYDTEGLVRFVKKALTDPNKKVRSQATYLLSLDVSDERKRKEFVPLIVPLLHDGSVRVRWTAAWHLFPWAADVPLAEAARALIDETHPKARPFKERLLRETLKAHDSAESKRE